MPRKCIACNHPDRTKIDQMLIENKSFRYVSKQFSISISALFRHKDHLSDHLVKSQKAEEISKADSLMDKLLYYESEARRIAKKTEDEDDFRSAISAIKELVKIVEVMAKIRGDIQEGQTINILISPEWIDIRSAILQALVPYPEAKKAVISALSNK